MQITNMFKSIQAMHSQHAAQREKQLAAHFTKLDTLKVAIRDEISPHVITLGGGSAFFMTPTWLASNAHVNANQTTLNEDLAIMDLSPAKLSFFRPETPGPYPDLMFAEIDNPSEGSIGLLPTLDQAYHQSYFFYVNANVAIDDPKHITFVSQKDRHGFTMREQATPGISGSPLIEARLILHSRSPKWVFHAQSIVYAQKDKTLLTMPALSDLDQIKTILMAHSAQERASKITQLLTSPQLQAQRTPYLAHTAKLSEQLTLLAQAYSSGECDYLIIRDPDSEELGKPRLKNFRKASIICDLKDSWLVKRSKNPIDIKILEASQAALLSALQIKDSVKLNGSDSTADQKELRLDFGTVKNGKLTHVMINIQDNTDDRPTNRKSSKSQCFANIKISENFAHGKTISGNLLAQLLTASISNKKTVLYPAEDFAHHADSEMKYAPLANSQQASN